MVRLPEARPELRDGFALTKPGRATALGSVALGVGMAVVATILILQLGTGDSRIAKMSLDLQCRARGRLAGLKRA